MEEEEPMPIASEENVKAATKLQAMQRGKQARREREEQIQAANKIGAIHRGRKARKERREQAEAARKMQAVARGRSARKAEKLKAKEKMDNALAKAFAEGVEWGFHPLNTQAVCTKIDISKTHLKSIALLPPKLPFLQEIDISNNKIGSLAAFKSLKYLHTINAENNKLRHCLEFCAASYTNDGDDSSSDNVGSTLNTVNLNRNKIIDTSHVRQHKFLRILKLDNNKIKSLTGLGNLKYLVHLSAANNAIESLDNWIADNGADSPKQLLNLDISGNKIVRLEPLTLLKNLQKLKASSNKILSLFGLQRCTSLNLLDIRNNGLISTSELDVLHTLRQLQELNMNGNPIENLEFYRWRVIYRMPYLNILDDQTISAKEKVKANCAHGSDIDGRMKVWEEVVGPEREFIQTVPVIALPEEKEEEEYRQSIIENNRSLIYRGRHEMCQMPITIDVYKRFGDGSDFLECRVMSDDQKMKLFTSFKPDSVEAHRSSVSKSQEIYSGNADVSDEDFCAAIAQRLQLRNMNDDSNENLSHRAWSDICDDPGLLSRVSLCLRPVPVHVSTNALYGMPMNIDITRDIDDRILITAYSMDNLRGTSFEVSYDEQFCRDSIADCEGIEPDEFESLDQLYQLMAEHCEIIRDQKADKLVLYLPDPPPDGPTMEKELARKRAKKKWDSLDEDGNGVLEGDELNGLAEWVWTSFHPGGKPISDREKAKLKKKLLKRIAVKHKGQMTFEDFHDWFLKTCDEIESFRALQAKHGIRKGN